jgi:hypothetical protein
VECPLFDYGSLDSKSSNSAHRRTVRCSDGSREQIEINSFGFFGKGWWTVHHSEAKLSVVHLKSFNKRITSYVLVDHTIPLCMVPKHFKVSTKHSQNLFQSKRTPRNNLPKDDRSSHHSLAFIKLFTKVLNLSTNHHQNIAQR